MIGAPGRSSGSVAATGLPCLVLPHESGDGPANMALDEALLDAALEAPGLAYFRTYEWREPTLSLGYFQAIGYHTAAGPIIGPGVRPVWHS